MAYYAGVDVGSLATKCVVVDQTGRVVARTTLPTGVSGPAAAEEAFNAALAAAALTAAEAAATVGTGYGRNRVPFADRAATEILCHARGAASFVAGPATLVDVGGQDVKAIRLDGADGFADFALNDRCAAGTGRFLEIMARALAMDLADLAAIAPDKASAAKVNNMCTVFAESEVVSLLHEGLAPAAIGAGVLISVGERVATLARRLGGGPYVMSGGVALNQGFVRALALALGAEVRVLPEPQLVGALGAALLARG